MDIFNIVFTAISVVGIPIIGLLFKQFKDLRDANDKLKENIQDVKMMIYRDYVSMAHMEKIMAPFQKDVNNLERMIERIASRLAIPAVHEE